MQTLDIDRATVVPKNSLFARFWGWFFALAFIIVGAFAVGTFIPRMIVLPSIAKWRLSHNSPFTSFTKRVTVAYPESWAANEYRNCKMRAIDPNSNLPMLDCDRLSRPDPMEPKSPLEKESEQFPSIPVPDDVILTPLSRRFVMDVDFSGSNEQPYWTCQNQGQALICRNSPVASRENSSGGRDGQ